MFSNQFFAGIFFGVIAFAITITLIEATRPTPLDVYRGKTELQVTYKGDTPIDSMVVFK